MLCRLNSKKVHSLNYSNSNFVNFCTFGFDFDTVELVRGGGGGGAP